MLPREAGAAICWIFRWMVVFLALFVPQFIMAAALVEPHDP
jgi:hypothetical protein